MDEEITDPAATNCGKRHRFQLQHQLGNRQLATTCIVLLSDLETRTP
jgi:hypothetical protein